MLKVERNKNMDGPLEKPIAKIHSDHKAGLLSITTSISSLILLLFLFVCLTIMNFEMNFVEL